MPGRIGSAGPAAHRQLTSTESLRCARTRPFAYPERRQHAELRRPDPRGLPRSDRLGLRGCPPRRVRRYLVPRRRGRELRRCAAPQCVLDPDDGVGAVGQIAPVEIAIASPSSEVDAGRCPARDSSTAQQYRGRVRRRRVRCPVRVPRSRPSRSCRTRAPARRRSRPRRALRRATRQARPARTAERPVSAEDKTPCLAQISISPLAIIRPGTIVDHSPAWPSRIGASSLSWLAGPGEAPGGEKAVTPLAGAFRLSVIPSRRPAKPGPETVVVAKAATVLPPLAERVLHRACRVPPSAVWGAHGAAFSCQASARPSGRLLLGCDMPFVTGELLAWLLAGLPGAAMAQSVVAPEPLLSRCLPSQRAPGEALLAAGSLRAGALVAPPRHCGRARAAALRGSRAAVLQRQRRSGELRVAAALGWALRTWRACPDSSPGMRSAAARSSASGRSERPAIQQARARRCARRRGPALPASLEQFSDLLDGGRLVRRPPARRRRSTHRVSRPQLRDVFAPALFAAAEHCGRTSRDARSCSTVLCVTCASQ